MLHPNTGIDLGREADEVRKENASFRAALAAADAELTRLRESNASLLEGLKCVADFASMPPRVSHGASNGKDEIDKLIADIALDLLKRVEYRLSRADGEGREG